MHVHEGIVLEHKIVVSRYSC